MLSRPLLILAVVEEPGVSPRFLRRYTANGIEFSILDKLFFFKTEI